jgi:hypothetical protein
MNLKTEKYIAFYAAAVLFACGVVCYAAFPEKKPETPVRAMFNSTTGNVLYFHKEHASKIDIENYALECIDCHHQWVKAETGDILYLQKDDTTGEKPIACRECHKVEKAEGDNPNQPKRADALHQNCGGCHDDSGHGPGTKDCSGCHVL